MMVVTSFADSVRHFNTPYKPIRTKYSQEPLPLFEITGNGQEADFYEMFSATVLITRSED